MELPAPNAKTQPSDTDASDAAKVPQGLREYVFAAKQKRAHAVLVLEEIAHVVLQVLPRQGRIHRTELIRRTADVLEFEEVALKRIDQAIRRLEELKQVSADSNYVWRRASNF